MDTEGGLLAKRQLSADEADKKQRLLAAGHAAFDEGDYARALDCYHRASLVDGSDAQVWSALGMAYANLDLVREAWRSYKLALASDETHVDTLWYAAEFLYNTEDFVLARVLLERYIALEEDPLRREEAREMLADAIREIGDDDDIRERPRYVASDDPQHDQTEAEELAGFEVEGEEQANEDWENDEAEDEFEGGYYEELAEDEFVAGLQLELTGMAAKCSRCGTGIPLDAPYCYNCLAPHIYQDEA
jgi:tetratricopeptide (TPR) repeat protein